MLVRIVEKYEDVNRIFRFGRQYEVDEGLAQVLIEGGFAEEVKRKQAAETAEDNPHKPAKRTRRKAENASDDS